jgi:CheY-like chemotaxis protein
MINLQNKRVLVLEDDLERIKQFKKRLIGNMFQIVSDAEAAILALTYNKWDVLFLDHDLGGESYVPSSNANTGYQVAKFLHDNPKYKPDEAIIIHSLNAVGAENMHNELPEAYKIPFAWTKINI